MEWLKALGLNEKQQRLYLYLLENGAATASKLAQSVGEQRTNIYLITEVLEQKGLVEKDESRPVVEFRAANPENLQKLMMNRQKQLAGSAAELKRALPELQGLYHLNTAHDGMAYFEGLKGYEAALEDMIRSQYEVCVFGASNVSRARPDAWSILQNKLNKRALVKVRTRILFEEALKETTDIASRKRQRMEVRFWGCSVFAGEVAIYGNTIVLTTYDEKLISLVIKNSEIATTMRAIFDTAWQAASGS